MKTKSIYLLIVVAIFAISCGDDKEDSPTPVEDTAVYFRCKLNGIAYTDDARFADYSFGTGRVVSQNDFELLKLEMSTDTTGTFIINSSNPLNSIVYIDTLQNVYKSISGTITISEASKSRKIISGTFTGELVNEDDATDKISVSEGKFNRVEYEEF
jgi:hypothetical protein